MIESFEVQENKSNAEVDPLESLGLYPSLIFRSYSV